MLQALELAKRALGKTYPNPAVGCVIVKDGKVGHKAIKTI
jgi:diaminohydroxyphosphoribosylaminopyrimidine deaminase/5-amino-6-(5-phosphoribosylamino)uracil reductase